MVVVATWAVRCGHRGSGKGGAAGTARLPWRSVCTGCPGELRRGVMAGIPMPNAVLD